MAHDLFKQAAELIHARQNILVFTGAGLSTESGIPDFRSPGGVWERYDPSDFYFHKILSDEKTREKYWQMSREFYLTMKDALPNSAHMALKDLEASGKLRCIVTQNIDHLHQKTGHSEDKIIEIHGTAFSVSCLNCRRKYDRDDIQKRLDAGDRVPRCDDCEGILKPDTISFGQPMPEEKMTAAIRFAEDCDLCIVLGSSLVVYPAAAIPARAVETGAELIIINRDPTPMDEKAHLVLHDSLSRALPEIMDLLTEIT